MTKKDPRKDNESGFGEYKEAPGGGTPVGKGTKHPEGAGRGGYNNAGRPGHRESDQPRTEDGKFTYNAVNGKELKEISKVDGHSRGTTIPPTLTGGENGHQYYADKDHKEILEGAESGAPGYTLFEKNAELVGKDWKIKLASRDFVESMQEYVVNEKGKEWAEKHGMDAKYFDGLKSGKFGEFKDTDTEKMKSKVGRHGAEEKAAIAEAKKEGTAGEQLVEAKPGSSDEATGVKTMGKTKERISEEEAAKRKEKPATTRDEDYKDDTSDYEPEAPKDEEVQEIASELGDVENLKDFEEVAEDNEDASDSDFESAIRKMSDADVADLARQARERLAGITVLPKNDREAVIEYFNDWID